MGAALAWAVARVPHPALIRFERVGYTYPARSSQPAVPVLHDVSFEAVTGEFVALIGPSGCGKSTLLTLLAGYLAPSAGRITCAGRQVIGPGRDRLMVFQQATLFPWLTSADNVAFGLRLKAQRRSGTAIAARVHEVLRLVRLEDVAGRYPGELSGGMRQRLEIARALAVDPAILLMDEPLSALDALTRRTVQREILAIWHATAKTILLVTHDIDEAIVMADRILVMAARPARVLREVAVSLPRPRERQDPAVAQLSRELASLLEEPRCCS
jgi:NitT/TauT family transport system ATP-binding protein